MTQPFTIKGRKLKDMCRAVLEAIIVHVRLSRLDIDDLAGYRAPQPLMWLKRLGLIEKVAGKWQATEAGKLYIAIIRGQEARARWLKKQNATALSAGTETRCRPPQ